jgi:hypothetical protein
VFHLLFSVEEGPSYLQRMVICSVFGCVSESGKSTNRENGIAFHRFPNREKFPKQYAQWTQCIANEKTLILILIAAYVQSILGNQTLMNLKV